ncbi:tripartite tricarboxylate transporter substrate binding protein [Bordetella sp. BOR01]|uniref:tripartite tricarboxylate transporter substrate binding protein n=1 Tax=Bordetella sp. BOR01 TaxID=2854779 RepID=UPI0021082484|nr:tripartite tricarboxylate transporter substrate binding protein [Bordetella sp. BOR01]
MKLGLWRGCAGMLVYLAIAGQAAVAADQAAYPSRTVSIVVPTTPGGTADLLARLVAPKLAALWGHPVIVENKPGAGTLVGTDYAAQAKPDGYTLLLTFNELATLPAINKHAKVDVVNGFERIGKIGTLPVLILANPKVKANTLKELIDEARQHPGKLTYASNGSGGVLQLYTEMFKQEAGVDIMHVPYRGALEASTAMLAGEVDVLVQFASGNVQNYVKANRTKAYAVASKERLPALPDIPTTAQAGLPSLELEAWYGMFAPAGTPQSIIEKVNKDFIQVLQMPDVRERLNGVGMAVDTGTPESFDAYFKNEYRRWTDLIVAAGIESN